MRDCLAGPTAGRRRGTESDDRRAAVAARGGLRRQRQGHRVQTRRQRPEPAVVGEADGIEQALPPQRPVPVLEPVIERPPRAIGGLDQRCVPARPPRFSGRLRAHDRIGRVVHPRAVEGTRTGNNDHVPGRGAGGTAHGGGHVIPASALADLRAFLGVGLHVPAFRVLPTVVHVLGRADHAQPVVGQLHVVAAAEEQVALAVLAYRVAGVDVAAQADVDRRTPRALDVIGPDHEIAARITGARREVDEVAALMLDDVRRPDRAHVAGNRMAERLPVDQVARVPDRQAGVGVEARVAAVADERGEGGVDVEDLAVVHHRADQLVHRRV